MTVLDLGALRPPIPDEEKEVVIAKTLQSPRKSVRRSSVELNFPRTWSCDGLVRDLAFVHYWTILFLFDRHGADLSQTQRRLQAYGYAADFHDATIAIAWSWLPSMVSARRRIQHYAVSVRRYLDEKFQDRWIGRRGPVEWAPRSPNLCTTDYFFNSGAI